MEGRALRVATARRLRGRVIIMWNKIRGRELRGTRARYGERDADSAGAQGRTDGRKRGTDIGEGLNMSTLPPVYDF